MTKLTVLFALLAASTLTTKTSSDTPCGLEDASSSQSSHPCPPGWLAFSRRCYRWFGNVASWADAETHCRQSVNATRVPHLVSIHSREEGDFVRDYVQKASGHDDLLGRGYWIGFNDRKMEGNFEWSDGSRSSYTNWDRTNNQPTNYMNEDCTERFLHYQNWNDWQCEKKLEFVCKL